MNRRDVLIGLGIFAAALLMRAVFAARLVFPPLDDPAFYIQTARHVAQGRGLVSDVLWNYFVPFQTVTHPSHEFWMPLATLAMAASIRLVGDTWPAAQLPGLIAGALLPVLAYALGRTVWSARRWAVLAAGLLISSAVSVYQSASGDSAALYAALSTAALLAAARVMKRPSMGLAALTGLLCGLSYLARSHGSLLIVAIGAAWLIDGRRDVKGAIKLIGGLIAGAGIVIGPWWVRNLIAFGSIQPFPLTTALAARDYGEWFNYINLPSLEKLLSDGLGPALALRGQALWHDVGVIALITFPFGVIGLLPALGRRQAEFRVFAIFAALIWLGVSGLFPVPALTGSFYHSAGTFGAWGAVGCVIAVKALFDRSRWRMMSVAMSAGVVALVIGQAALAWPGVWADSRVNALKYEAVAQWLRSNAPPDQPIVTNEAHSLNYASGYAALTLPHQEDVTVLRTLADKYGARVVVVFGSIGLYPQALAEAAGVRLRAEWPDVRIYELGR